MICISIPQGPHEFYKNNFQSKSTHEASMCIPAIESSAPSRTFSGNYNLFRKKSTMYEALEMFYLLSFLLTWVSVLGVGSSNLQVLRRRLCSASGWSICWPNGGWLSSVCSYKVSCSVTQRDISSFVLPLELNAACISPSVIYAVSRGKEPLTHEWGFNAICNSSYKETCLPACNKTWTASRLGLKNDK